jgi:acetylornithine/succinyldiaminopimelate/putrescine aminotransferase
MFVVPPIIINEEQLREAYAAIDKALSIGDTFAV